MWRNTDFFVVNQDVFFALMAASPTNKVIHVEETETVRSHVETQAMTEYPCQGSDGRSVTNTEVERAKQLQEMEELIAALKIVAVGEKDRLQNKGITVDECRQQLRTARQHRK
jgi:predicted metal-dependent TIM-barrel fold hydrolase